ncbi:MAG: peptidoglycan DD-metalloendopeptidase family protein [Gammaproteobacteria bacterium]
MNPSEHRIRHDYKPLPTRKRRTGKALWFISGLAIPFVALSIATLMGSNPAEPGVVPANLTRTTIDLQLPGVARDAAPTIVGEGHSSDDVAAVTDRPGSAVITLVIRPGNTLDALFRRNNLNLTDLAAILQLPEAKRQLRLLHPGDQFTIVHDAGDILELNRRLDETSTLAIKRNHTGFAAHLLEHPVEARIAHAHAEIESSLFEAATAAGLSDQMTMNVAGIFAWDIDFVLDIRSGDEFVVLYEQLWQDGQYQRDGEVIAAEFTNNGRKYRAVRYEDPNGEANYFTPEGLSMRKAFLRAPVDFNRISSRFNPRRLHPIFKTVRPHRGVDYAASQGTPVKAAGDGKVTFRGAKGGLGNAIVLQHGGNIETVYGHLSRFARASRTGARVKQGQIIGYVGKTGWATGPHLHYEYRINGVHRNPRTVPLPKARPVRADFKQDFLDSAEPLLAQLDVVKRSRLAVNAVAAP